MAHAVTGAFAPGLLQQHKSKVLKFADELNSVLAYM